MRNSTWMAGGLTLLLAVGNAAAVTMQQGPISIAIAETVTTGPGDPSFDRPTDGSDDMTCAQSGLFTLYDGLLLTLSNSSLNPVSFTLGVTMAGAEGGAGTLADPFLALYSTFNPFASCSGLIEANDNGAPNGVDAVVSEALTLPAMASVSRTIVLTSAQLATGTFQAPVSITFPDADPIVVFTVRSALNAPGVGVPLLSGLAGVATLLALVGFGLRRLRA